MGFKQRNKSGCHVTPSCGSGKVFSFFATVGLSYDFSTNCYEGKKKYPSQNEYTEGRKRRTFQNFYAIFPNVIGCTFCYSPCIIIIIIINT